MSLLLHSDQVRIGRININEVVDDDDDDRLDDLIDDEGEEED